MINFFTNVFNNTKIPEKAYFGILGHSTSLIVGGIYMGAYVYTGKDKGIWLLLDRELLPIKGVKYSPVRSTKNSKVKLTWLHTDIEYVDLINNEPLIWQSYNLASLYVINTPKGCATRQDFVHNKILLSNFWNQKLELIDSKELHDKLEHDVVFSKQLSKDERNRRLKNAKIIPDKIEIKSTGFIRNPDVIAEVLERANGFCEICRKKAPFNRDSDNSPFLEVHHKIPLSKGGEDTVKNAIALCPNCHRHAHYGEKTFKFE